MNNNKKSRLKPTITIVMINGIFFIRRIVSSTINNITNSIIETSRSYKLASLISGSCILIQILYDNVPTILLSKSDRLNE